MDAIVVPLAAIPAALTAIGAVRHRAVARRERDAFVAAMATHGLPVEGTEPWRATGTWEGRPVTITTEPVRLRAGAFQDLEKRGTRFTVQTPTGDGRTCVYVNDRTILRFADLGSLTPVQLGDAFDAAFVSAASHPAALRARIDEDNRKRLLALGNVLWVEIGGDAVTLAVDDRIESMPRILDALDLVCAIAMERPAARPLVVPKLGPMTYWSLVIVLPIAAFWPTWIALSYPSATAALEPIAPQPDGLARALATFDVFYLLLGALLGAIALVRPLRPLRRE